MAGSMSRNKGQRGEREVLDLMQNVINEVYGSYDLEPPQLKRNTTQSDRGGDDIVGLEWMAPEVKYQETFVINQWWAQAERQAGANKEPVLFYRKNRVPWTVRLRLRAHVGDQQLTIVSTIDIDSFLVWFRLQLVMRLSNDSYIPALASPN